MRTHTFATILLLTATSPAGAQEAPAVFSSLHGEWQGDGTLMGRDAAFSLRWDVRQSFASLSFDNAFAGPDGIRTPVLSAAAVYRLDPDRSEAVWFDSRGVRIEIRWTATDSVLVSEWTAPEETGRTTYRVLGPDALEVIDEVARDGTLRIFGRATYARVKR